MVDCLRLQRYFWSQATDTELRPFALSLIAKSRECVLKSPGYPKENKPFLVKVCRVREAPELLLHSLTKDTLHRRKHRRNTSKLGIEIARIGRARDGRDERSRHPLVVDVVPVDVPKESMGHDLLRVRGARAKAQFGLAGEQFLEDGDGVAGHVDGVEGLVGENGVVDFVFVFAAEGGLLEEHLVD